MHILASHYRSEFLGTPQLFRVDHAWDGSERVPTLLIKASTLLLKYIAQGSPIKLVVAKCADGLLYGLMVFDDIEKPAIIWSIAEREIERIALMALASVRECPLFLFNELALNVAWTTTAICLEAGAFDLISSASIGPVDYPAMKRQAVTLLDKLFEQPNADASHFLAAIEPIHEWKETFNHYVTNRGENHPIHLFNRDEGFQQEQLAVWLTDSLQLSGVVHSPQIPKNSGRRELTDLLLTYERGTILIESKTLTVFNRPHLPTRDALASDVVKHIGKAVNQLRGAIRKLQQHVPVFDKAGVEIQVERSQPIHSIVLVPEFDLIREPSAYGRVFIAEFMQATKGFLHLLDIAELLRVVQAAEVLAKNSKRLTPMMAFDSYLIERAQKTLSAGTLCIEVLLRAPN
jgi:hypothetical protein